MEKITKAEMIRRMFRADEDFPRTAKELAEINDGIFQVTTRLAEMPKEREIAGWFLAECQMMDGSRLGERIILPFGPGCTFKLPPFNPFSPRGLASDMSVCIAYTDEV